MIEYPPAQWKGDGDSGGSWMDVPYRVVLHTTETEGLPGYNGGSSAPHLTYDPRSRVWTQHTGLEVAARALRNLDGGVQTNRNRALQVEIICYSDKGIADDDPADRDWVGELPDTAYRDLADFTSWCRVNFGVDALKWPEKQALNYEQAMAPGFRMSAAEWNDFDGICGHQHVTENDHWDPGAFEWDRLMEATMSTWKSKDGYTYTDVDEWDPHENGIKFVIDGGIMLGDRTRGKSDARFNAQDDISRGEFATVMKRFADDVGLGDEVTD